VLRVGADLGRAQAVGGLQVEGEQITGGQAVRADHGQEVGGIGRRPVSRAPEVIRAADDPERLGMPPVGAEFRVGAGLSLGRLYEGKGDSPLFGGPVECRLVVRDVDARRVGHAAPPRFPHPLCPAGPRASHPAGPAVPGAQREQAGAGRSAGNARHGGVMGHRGQS
jgi:hypothetical protein